MQKIRADLREFARHEQNSLDFVFAARMVLLTPGFQFVLTRRLQEMLVRIPLVGRLLRRILWWFASLVFSSELAIGAEIGGGLYIPHPYGIVVGAAKIGRNVHLLQNVTLGRKTPLDAGDPVVEDGVVIAAGAVVLGAVTVGRNATVGANSVVLQDVPEGCVAIGIPARIIPARRTLP
jgi:serine O-acetyltransferase